MYLKLTDPQLNLATSYQRWQMERYGNILPPGTGHAPADDGDRIIEEAYEAHEEEKYYDND